MTSYTKALTEAERSQCERIWKRYWGRPAQTPAGIEPTVMAYVFQWALLHWETLQPLVDREVLYASTEDIPMTPQHWERRIATKAGRRVRK